MARQLRIEFPGAVYHVTSRGNGRQRIFITDKDRLKFVKALKDTVGRFGIIIHAYCLMGNHYHLLLETPDPILSRSMKHLNAIYTQNFNWRHGRSGHVFQGRFKAFLVEKGHHLLGLIRYIVLNPVRAGLVEGPELWRWSSYRATGGMEIRPKWLTVQWVLSQFEGDRRSARRRYREFVREGLGKKEDPWKQVVGQLYLGSEPFIRNIRWEAGRGDIMEHPVEQRKPNRLPLDELMPEGGTSGEIFQARREGYTQREMARHLGVHDTTITFRIRRSLGRAVSEV